ncbi:MAG: hypothetical protein ACP5KE_09685, partial [Candidatus Methanodesulfokora sp.]
MRKLLIVILLLLASAFLALKFLENLQNISPTERGVPTAGLNITSNKTLPSKWTHLSISWMPTRVINDKIYDINVSVEVSNASEARITLIPKEYEYFITKYGMRKDDYPLVFPPEETRSIELKVEKRSFSVEFKDLKGGREYIIVAEVKGAGGSITEKVEIPYIRQFENIAKLDNILVGAYYYPWYSPYRHWSEGYKGRPILGEYDSRDPIVISKHIDWATGHGIDFFIMSWWGPGSWEDITIRDFFLKNQLIDNIKFMILYESVGRLKVEGGSIDMDSPANRQILLDDFKYLENYFNDPHYLRVKGRPAVELYLARIFKGNISGVISSLRDLYLIGDLVYWQDPRSLSEVKYDAITSYNMHTSVQEILDKFEENLARKYGEWLDSAGRLKVGFIPSVLP